MGEWKAQLSIRVRQDLRREMEDFASTERRKLGNVGEVLLEWAWEQLKVVGTIDRLLKLRAIKKNRTQPFSKSYEPALKRLRSSQSLG